MFKFLDGKKTAIGLVITILSALAGALPAVLALVGVEAVAIAQYVGIATTIVGVAHKLYKYLYNEEHP